MISNRFPLDDVLLTGAFQLDVYDAAVLIMNSEFVGAIIHDNQ